MFGKDSKKLETIVGRDSEVKGELTVKETVRIDGFLEGNVRADWVIVGETGRILGDIRSRGTVVGGRVEGNIESDGIVELQRKSQVIGEIRTEKLSIAEGAMFEGVSRMKASDEASDAADANVRMIKPTSIPS